MTTPSAPQPRPTTPSSDKQRGQPIQTGALSGGQPGQGVDTPSSKGQSNVDAAVAQGVEYGKDNLRKR